MQQRYTENDFARYYRTYMEDKVFEIEEKRKQSLKKLQGPKKRTMILLLIYAVLCLLFNIQNGFGSIIHQAVGGLMIYTFSYLLPYQTENKKLLGEIKQELVLEVIRFLDRGLMYEPQNYIQRDIFLEANLYRKENIDRYGGEDYIYGTIGNTSIAFSEVHAENKTKDSEGRTKYVTVFKGLFFEVDFHKTFNGVLYITRNAGFFSKVFGANKPNNNREKLEQAMLENPQFQDRFLVRTSDQILARYLLTPSFMERILQFEDQTKSRIVFSFREGKLYLGIETDKDHFDFDLKETLNQKVLYAYFQEVKIALDIIEELHLNTNIWK